MFYCLCSINQCRAFLKLSLSQCGTIQGKTICTYENEEEENEPGKN